MAALTDLSGFEFEDLMIEVFQALRRTVGPDPTARSPLVEPVQHGHDPEHRPRVTGVVH